MDRTLILVKPDAFARGLTGEILARFERKGLKIVALERQHARARRLRRTMRSTRSVPSSASWSTSSRRARSSRPCWRVTRPSGPRAR